MSVPELQLSLESLVQMCRRLHEAAVHEAELAKKLAGMGETCTASALLLRSYNNVLGQLQSQFSHPFVTNIPVAGENTEAIHLPALTAQLLGAVRAFAAPMMTPEIIERAWDSPEDAAYDDL